jgi:thymidylate kinase
MFSVTLIGPDGAGKTTITRRLESSGLLPFRYLYMGVNISASNAALPTSRLAEWLKQISRRRAGANSVAPANRIRAPRRGARARIRAIARITNRLAEEWFRQGVSWYYQLRGYVVLYDRHFALDFAPEITSDQPISLERRLHGWFLTHLYPLPDLVIFLDAPGEVLFARKGESTVEELERRRQGFLRQGERLPAFVRVDATRPLEEVYQDVAGCIVRFAERRRLPDALASSAELRG